MTIRDHTAAWKRLRKSAIGLDIGEQPRSLRARLSRLWSRWTTRRDREQQLRMEVAHLRMSLTRIEAALTDERRRRRQVEASLAAERYARAAFLNTMQWPAGRRPQG